MPVRSFDSTISEPDKVQVGVPVGGGGKGGGGDGGKGGNGDAAGQTAVVTTPLLTKPATGTPPEEMALTASRKDQG